MKKIVTLILISSMLMLIFSSCQNNDDVTNSGIDISDQNKSGTSLILNVNASASTGKYVYYDDWVKAIKEKYNIDIRIDYVPAMDYQNFNDEGYISDSIKDGSMTGLILLNSQNIDKIMSLKEAGYILPLSEYLEDNMAFNQLPSDMVDGYMIDGELYAIPAGYSMLPSIRLIQKSLLNETGLSKPETLDELYQFLLAVKAKGKSPLVILRTNRDIITYSTKDLFYANGCYISYQGMSSISFDPLTGAYEDFMLKAEATDTLNYFNLLLQNQLIVRETLKNLTQILGNPNTGSYYSEVYNRNDLDNYEMVYGLRGSNDKYLNLALMNYYTYVVASNTENPKQMVNDFVNTFLLDKEGYLMSYFGVEGKSYEMKGNDVIRTGNDSRIMLTQLDIRYMANPETKYLDETGNDVYPGLADLSASVRQLLDTDQMFPYTYNLYSPGYTNGISELFGISFRQFANAGGNASVEDFIAEYRKNAKEMGGSEVLSKINGFYHYTSAYDYH
ncbi:MAG: extracellular solute-binding protein [Clostridia bacterium]|nr:extracellular solute-binding protein [Clostridia bacterium]